MKPNWKGALCPNHQTAGSREADILRGALSNERVPLVPRGLVFASTPFDPLRKNERSRSLYSVSWF